ncbi:MAG: hypothetical protein J6S04_03565 [Clostridia bacterium]|nr:hypothetical protein [Clostridia bacterium]
MSNKKVEPWRIAAFIIAVAFIIFMWVRKDVAEIYATMPKEEIAPLIATTVAVSLLKIALIAGAVFLVKWFVGKIAKK